MAIHFPGFLTAYCSCDSKKRNLGYRPGDGYREFGCTCLVRQLGCEAFCVPAHSGPSTVFRATGEKKFLWAMNCFFIFLAFSPSQADRFFFFLIPNTTLPTHFPDQTLCPTPKCLYSYLTSKYTLASFKTLVLWKHVVSYLEAKWECLFCTVLETAHLSYDSPQCRTPSHKLIQSTKQVHTF